LTCDLDVYTKRITNDPETARQQGQLQGIYNRNNPSNPFRDYTHVYIPYCTGDLHWGNKTQTYRGVRTYTVEHRGAVNAAAAVNWALQNVVAPSQVTVAGCSAGGYGAALWSAQILARYPGAAGVELADSAAGVSPRGFFQTILPAWGVDAGVWPSFIPSLSLDRIDQASVSLPDLYSGIAGYFPLAGFAQYNTLQDTTQTLFYGLMLGGIATPDQWSAQMQQNVATIKAQNPNFAAYTAPGTQHCIINRPEFYQTTVAGVALSDWVSRLVATRRPGSVP